MSAPPVIRRECADESATLALGAALARALPSPPSRALRVYLRGELGAGKTTLVRGILRALGETGAVRSPTYAVLHTYELAPWSCAHLDLYRIERAADLQALGLPDLDRAGGLWLIEWPERAGSEWPAPDLDIALSGAPTGHSIQIRAGSEIGARWLTQLDSSDRY